MIGILDLNIGNIGSLSNSIYSSGYDFQIISNLKNTDHLSHLILPGVGNYGQAAKGLKKTGLIQEIKDFANSGRPLMGICLGMQLLLKDSEEGAGNNGLNLIPGKVVKIKNKPGFRVPHVGWNDVAFIKDHPVFDGIKQNRDFYFVHSYHVICDEKKDIAALTEYSDTISSIISRENIIGFQFHPEKSQINGIRIIENFCEWNGQC